MPRDRAQGVRSFFKPRSIAVAGVSADPDKLGSIIFANLLEHRAKGVLKAQVYALNPARDRIGDQPCYPSVRALPETPELLVVAVPEPQTAALVKEGAESGVKAAVIVTSGYAESGRKDVEEKIGKVAAKHGMRILGPNTIGLVDPWSGVDTLFLRPTKRLPDGSEVPSMRRPLKGGVAVVTQSGHLGQAITEELTANGVGIRALVGTGNQLDVSVEDVIEFLAKDPDTKVIAVYLEGVRDGRRFIEVASRASREKPLVAFKVGKTGAGAKAALTHTASLVGDYEVYRAAFRRAGTVEAESFEDLVDYSIALSMLPQEGGHRLAIVTNAGGVGAIAADEAERAGLKVEPLAAADAGRLRAKFRASNFIANSSLGNPVDLTASVSSDEFAETTGFVMELPQYDLGMVLPTHQAPGMGHDVAERFAEAISKSGKPCIVCVIGNSDFATRIHMEFMRRGIPSLPTPERAVRALAALAKYIELREGLKTAKEARKKPPRRLVAKGGPLSPQEVSDLLRSYGIQEPDSVMVRKPEDLARAAKLNRPVACKLVSPGLLHKTDVGGVIVDVRDKSAMEAAFRRFGRISAGKGIRFGGMLVQEMAGKGVELILGGTRDPTFGPLVVVGLGGTYTEQVRDYALAVAPVSEEEAKQMIGRTKLQVVLAGYRGGPKVNIGALCRVISSFSRIMADNPVIDQIEVNPLIVTGRGALAVDARAVLASGS